MVKSKKIILQNTALCMALIASYVCIGFILPPVWLTNDDVGMMMLFEGIGIALEPTDNLFFSHVFYAKLMRYLPSVFGLSQYVVAYYLMYITSAIAVICFVRSIQEAAARNILVDYFFFFFIFLFPTLNPQFTLNAGIAALAGYLSLFLYINRGLFRYLFLYFLFSVISFSIRREEFYLISIAAFAVFFLRRIKIKRVFVIFTIIPVLTFLALADHFSYDNTWDAFNKFQSIRPLLIDNGGFERALKKDNISGPLSRNDCELLSSWFFADPALLKVADWKYIYNKYVDFDVLSRVKKGIYGIFLAIRDINLLPLFIFMVASCLRSFKWRTVSYLLYIFMLIFIVGFYGRIDVVRVFYPAAALFCVFIFSETKSCFLNNKKHLYTNCAIALFVFSFNFLQLYTSSGFLEKRYRDLDYITNRYDDLILWGDGIDSRTLYPPFMKKDSFPRVKLIGLGWNALVPFSRSCPYIQNNSFKSAIQSDTGVFFITSNGVGSREIEALRKYSQEHLSRKLEVKFEFLECFVLVNAKCK